MRLILPFFAAALAHVGEACNTNSDCDHDEYCNDEQECSYCVWGYIYNDGIDGAGDWVSNVNVCCNSNDDCDDSYSCNEYNECSYKECNVHNECGDDQYCSEDFECWSCVLCDSDNCRNPDWYPDENDDTAEWSATNSHCCSDTSDCDQSKGHKCSITGHCEAGICGSHDDCIDEDNGYYGRCNVAGYCEERECNSHGDCDLDQYCDDDYECYDCILCGTYSEAIDGNCLAPDDDEALGNHCCFDTGSVDDGDFVESNDQCKSQNCHTTWNACEEAECLGADLGGEGSAECGANEYCTNDMACEECYLCPNSFADEFKEMDFDGECFSAAAIDNGCCVTHEDCDTNERCNSLYQCEQKECGHSCYTETRDDGEVYTVCTESPDSDCDDGFFDITKYCDEDWECYDCALCIVSNDILQYEYDDNGEEPHGCTTDADSGTVTCGYPDWLYDETAGEYLDSDRCAAAGCCAENSDCPTGEVCGRLYGCEVPECELHSDCDAGEYCDDNYECWPCASCYVLNDPVPAEGACRRADDDGCCDSFADDGGEGECNDGQTCSDYWFTCGDVECEQHSDCNPNESCITNLFGGDCDTQYCDDDFECHSCFYCFWFDDSVDGECSFWLEEDDFTGGCCQVDLVSEDDDNCLVTDDDENSSTYGECIEYASVPCGEGKRCDMAWNVCEAAGDCDICSNIPADCDSDDCVEEWACCHWAFECHSETGMCTVIGGDVIKDLVVIAAFLLPIIFVCGGGCMCYYCVLCPWYRQRIKNDRYRWRCCGLMPWEWGADQEHMHHGIQLGMAK